jgi:signal transduction histidine kinase
VNTLLIQVIDSLESPENIQINVITKMPELMTNDLDLKRVFQNLISNSVIHHPGPQGIIEISCREDGNYWEFSIRDDGAGIEPRHHERIFQLFQRLQTSKDVESTGIGLALVRKIISEVGGNVWVESQGTPGQGSKFCFTWPKKL